MAWRPAACSSTAIDGYGATRPPAATTATSRDARRVCSVSSTGVSTTTASTLRRAGRRAKNAARSSGPPTRKRTRSRSAARSSPSRPSSSSPKNHRDGCGTRTATRPVGPPASRVASGDAT